MDKAGGRILPVPFAGREVAKRAGLDVFDVTGLRPSNDDLTGELEVAEPIEVVESIFRRENPPSPALVRSLAKRSFNASATVPPVESPEKTCPFLFTSSDSSPEVDGLENRDIGTCCCGATWAGVRPLGTVPLRLLSLSIISLTFSNCSSLLLSRYMC